MVSVPVVSVNEVSSVTVTAPSMRISSDPIGSTSLLQFCVFDQRLSPPPPFHTPSGSGTVPVVPVAPVPPVPPVAPAAELIGEVSVAAPPFLIIGGVVSGIVDDNTNVISSTSFPDASSTVSATGEGLMIIEPVEEEVAAGPSKVIT